MGFPAEFIRQMEAVLGEQGAASLCAHMEEPASVAVRFNPLKTDAALRSSVLAAFGVPADAEDGGPEQAAQRFATHSRLGSFLPERPEFYLDPLLHAGAYYVQEASSMYLEHILPIMKGMRSSKPTDAAFRVLDLCASPGGKSTHLLSMLSEIEKSFLVSNEVIKSRTSALCENISKWGCANSVVVNNDPADFSALPSFFDVIVVDAPCSGEGMFRKDPVAVQEWSPENVQICAARQRRILTDIMPSLRPGGLLVYSTCTFNHSEDEDNVRWIQDTWSGFELLGQHHFYPGDEKAGEGFFIAVLRHDGDISAEDNLPVQRGKKAHGTQVKLPFKEAPTFVNDGYVFSMKGDMVKAYPAGVCNDMRHVESCMRVLQSGVLVASTLEDRKKGRVTLVPEYSLIQSSAYRRGSLPEEEVDLETAVAYLRLDAVVLPSDAPLGHVVLTYRGVPFGLVKNIGRRSNNLLPNSLRIRKQ